MKVETGEKLHIKKVKGYYCSIVLRDRLFLVQSPHTIDLLPAMHAQ